MLRRECFRTGRRPSDAGCVRDLEGKARASDADANPVSAEVRVREHDTAVSGEAEFCGFAVGDLEHLLDQAFEIARRFRLD